MKVGRGAQLDFGEEVAVASIDPVSRDKGAREKALFVSDELVDDFIDDLLGEVWYNH